jgi:hypothetical protein
VYLSSNVNVGPAYIRWDAKWLLTHSAGKRHRDRLGYGPR